MYMYTWQSKKIISSKLLISGQVPCLFIEEDTKYPEIKVTDFIQHTRNMHANSDDGFSAEFEEICNRTRTDLSAEASYLPENKAKNRYVNISACKCVHYLISFPGPSLDIKYLSPIFHKTSCLRVNKCKYYWYCQILCEQ